MTKFATDWQQDIIPDFDVLKWKQENQARIRRETAGMTDEEVRERRRQAVEEDKRWRAEQATENLT
jgi:hypothetical protein